MQGLQNLLVVFAAMLTLSAVTAQYQRDEFGSQIDHDSDYHSPAYYSFEYSVNDPNTGDVKSHKETRRGDLVKGYYTLSEPDGTRRHVEYNAGRPRPFSTKQAREETERRNDRLDFSQY